MNIIIITNSRKDVVKLVKKYYKTDAMFFLYSDSSEFHSEAKEISITYGVTINASFYTNYDNVEEVWEKYYLYTEKINEWSRNIHKNLNLPPSLFYWTLNNEGWNSSVIFNSLLTSKFLRGVLDIPGNSKVYIRNDFLEYKDTELILSSLCKDRKEVTVSILGPIFPYYSRLFLIYSRAVLHILKIIFNSTIHKFASPQPKPKSFNNFCVFHYVGASFSRIEGELSYFEKVYEKGLPVLVLTENCSIFPLRYNQKKIKITRIESWLKLSMVLKSLKLSFQSFRLIFSNVSQITGFIKEREIGLMIKHYLLISSLNYYPRNLLSHLMLSEFTKNNKISMFRIPGLSNISGLLDCDVISKNKDIQIFSGLTKHNTMSVFRTKEKFEIDVAAKYNVLVFIEEKYKNNFTTQGVKRNNIEFFYSQILSSQAELIIEMPLKDSILKKLEGNYVLKILVDATDPGAPSRTPQEHYNYMKAFIDLAKENPNVLFIFKPHSANKREISEGIVRRNMQDNIVLLNKHLAGVYFFKYADLFCSRSSTMMYNAVASKIPCLGVKLEGLIYDVITEKNFKFAYSVKELRSIIISLIGDQNYCDEWLGSVIKYQDEKFEIDKMNVDINLIDTEDIMIQALNDRYFKKA